MKLELESIPAARVLPGPASRQLREMAVALAGLGTAVPLRCYTQAECWAAVQAAPRFAAFSDRSQALLRRLFRGDNGIERRHLALDDLRDAFELTPDAQQRRFERNAPVLAAEAGRRALADAHLNSAAVDAIVVSTCTGYLCPGLSSYTCEHLGLRRDVLAVDLVGQGCGAAIPNWSVAEALIAAGRCRAALCICVEVCSAALYLDDDPGVLVSASLFGDGAGATVWRAAGSGAETETGLRLLRSLTMPEDRDCLRFEHRGGMLRNKLTREVPAKAAAAVETILDDVLRAAGLERADIRAWILHPGGREVLTAIRERLGLEEEQLSPSREVLRHYGNLSSASVYFVLQEALKRDLPVGPWLVAAFGAGFSCHAALLEVGRAASRPREFLEL